MKDILKKEFGSKLEDRKIYYYMESNKIKVEEVIKDYSNYIYKIIRNFNLNLSTEDAEEVVLDVFLALWKNTERLDINQSMTAYIGGITKNLIKYKFRGLQISDNIDDYQEKISDFENVEEIIIENQRQKIILEELNKFKKEDKAVFVEYYYENSSIKDIGEKLKMSESKVKSKLFRVRKKLSKSLKEMGYGYEE